MQNILIGDQLIMLPSCYNEATPSQIRTITRLSLKELSDSAYKLLVFMVLLPAKGLFLLRFRWFFRRKSSEFLLEIDEFGDEVTQFLGSKTPFYVQKFPFLNGRIWDRLTSKKLFGPGDMLDGLVFRQFRMSEEYAFAFQQKRDFDSLDRLITTLYLPSSYEAFWCISDPDQRLSVFEEKRVQQRLGLVQTLPFDLKISIFLWYKGCRTMISQQFPRIFRKTSGGESSGPEINSDDIAESWANLLDGLAETAPAYSLWDSTGLYDVLHNYEKKLLEMDRVKAMRANAPA